MSPTRRQFLITYPIAAGAALALLPAVGFTQSAAVLPPGSTIEELAPHGLPSTKRLSDVWCSECGEFMYAALLDEMDSPTNTAVCKDCFVDKQAELDEAIDANDRDWDEADADELQNTVDEYESWHKELDHQFATIYGRFLNIHDDQMLRAAHNKRIDWMRDALDDMQRLLLKADF